MSASEVPIGGYCRPEFSAVEDAFRDNFARRNEIGASVCVYKDGDRVVDLWGGYRDRARTTPWAEDTITLMNSVAKSMCAACVHMLIDRGEVALDAPVATYWPEFAQNGKAGVTVKHVLGHRCGVIFADAAKPGDWFDYPAQVAAIEVAAPAWPPETKGAYNSINIGFILGEVVRRVSGQTVGAFLRAEISAPLGAEYNIGLTKDEVALVAPMHENPANRFWAQGAEAGSNLNRAWAGRPLVDDMLNRPEIREGELPSFGGHGNARGMATIYAMLAGDGEVNGVRLLRPETVGRLSKLQWEGICAMTGWPMRMGLGFMHNSPPYIPMGSNMRAFGHLGSGGALGFCDRQANLAFAYATNFQCSGAGEGDRCQALVEAAAGRAPAWQPAAAE